MHHPFFSTLRGQIAFVAGWVVVSTIHFAIVFFLFNLEIPNAIADSLLSTTLWALFATGLWYWVRFTDIETGKTIPIVINHIGAAALSVFIHVYITISILKFFSEPGSAYSTFIDASTTGRIFAGIVTYLFLAMAFYLIIYIQNFREKLIRESELKSLVKDAELNWLKLQVNPHFLFNSLNSVSSLTITEPEKAQEMIIRLSELLRYSLRQSPSSMVPLEREIECCIDYLEIERVRFGSRLSYRFEVAPECLNFEVPGMIIQPLFENAIKHGVAQTADETEVVAKAYRLTTGICLEVSNTLITDPLATAGAGVGLENIKRRLKLIYGSESLLTITQSHSHFVVKIIFPITL
jgi:sensor histidine kinase YesM